MHIYLEESYLERVTFLLWLTLSGHHRHSDDVRPLRCFLWRYTGRWLYFSGLSRLSVCPPDIRDSSGGHRRTSRHHLYLPISRIALSHAAISKPTSVERLHWWTGLWAD